MQMVSSHLPYSSTGYFSTIVSDYISGAAELMPFYQYPVSFESINTAIEQRRQFNTDRRLLVEALQQQYQDIVLSDQQNLFLQQLVNENTFTICTAHQPNIFTGHLYFIYKILHTIKLAASLKEQSPENNFVPVYYMGSEDADLDELGHIYLDGIRNEWKTAQKGAVGRMKVDKALLQLIDQLSGQLLVHDAGEELVSMLKQCYQAGTTIEQATFKLVNELFAGYGLLVLLPDSRLLKKAFADVIKKELLEQFSHTAVAETVASFPARYKIQASGRALNLFYLKDDSRERIEQVGTEWEVVNTGIRFTKEALLNELKIYPERFSPNVILRPVFQEMILPNIAFIGGGGEIAYWLELKKVFEAAAVPYPMLVVRNSFLLINAKSESLMRKLQLPVESVFKPAFELMNELVKRDSSHQLSLDEQKAQLTQVYGQLKKAAAVIDITLAMHTDNLHKKSLQKIEALEKKMLRAEKKNFEAAQRQLYQLKKQLFPNDNLQERVENFMLYYAKSGKEFIHTIYKHSLSLEQEFVVLEEK